MRISTFTYGTCKSLSSTPLLLQSAVIFLSASGFMTHVHTELGCWHEQDEGPGWEEG